MSRIWMLGLGAAALMSSTVAGAAWTANISVGHVEVHATGVFVTVASLSGLTESGCTVAQQYTFIQFPSTNEKLADRALSSIYYAQSTGKRFKVFIERCNGAYVIANAIWIE